MKCKDVEARLTEYVDGTLPAAESAAVQEHLLHCPSCARSAAVATFVHLLLARIREQEEIVVPANFEALLMQRLQDEQSLFILLDFSLAGGLNWLLELLQLVFGSFQAMTGADLSPESST